MRIEHILYVGIHGKAYGTLLSGLLKHNSFTFP